MFQALEAVISFLFFASICSLLFSSGGSGMAIGMDQEIHDPLYRMQLANDIWRALYLKGAFTEFGEVNRQRTESILDEIGEEAGFCIFIDGIEFTNCRSGEVEHPIKISQTRFIVYGGKVKTVQFSIS